MVCSTAYLIREPSVTEVTENAVSVWNPKTKRFNTHYEPFLVPEYHVSLSYDYGSCCGIDWHEEKFATRQEAQDFIDRVYCGLHPWLKYDPDYIESEDSDE